MNSQELRAEFEAERAASSKRVGARLEAGDDVDLLEAVAFCNIRKLRELWPLAMFKAFGRFGSPLARVEEIPATAWPSLRMVMIGADAVLETPDGLWVYDVRLSASRDLSTPGEAPPDVDEQPAAHVERDVDAVIVELVQRASRGAVSLADCEMELGKVGVSVNKERIVGVVIDTTARAVRGSGSTKLSNVLMAVQLRLNSQQHVGTRRDVTRQLFAWVRLSFPDLRVVSQENQDDDDLDRLGNVLKSAGLV